jgi:hypothetical protein
MIGDVSVLIGAAAVVSAASAVTLAVDRFRDVGAGLLCLAAGIFPWLPLVDFQELVMLSLVGTAPLSVVASIFYGAAKREGTRPRAAVASLVGLYAAVAYTLILFSILSSGE